jgi:hypothetical protein
VGSGSRVNRLLKYDLKEVVKIPEQLLEELELVAKGSFGVDLFVAFRSAVSFLHLYRDTEVIPEVSR